MAKGFSPLIGLAVVVALAMVAVFGALSLNNATPVFAQDATVPVEVYVGTPSAEDVNLVPYLGGGSVQSSTTPTSLDASIATAATVSSFGVFGATVTGVAVGNTTIRLAVTLTDNSVVNITLDVEVLADTPATAVGAIPTQQVAAGAPAETGPPVVAATAGAPTNIDLTQYFAAGGGATGAITGYAADITDTLGVTSTDVVDAFSTVPNAPAGTVANILALNAVAGVTADNSYIVTVTATDGIAPATAPSQSFFVDVVAAGEADMDADAVLDANSDDPGKKTRYTIEFTADGDGGVAAGTQELVIELEDFGFPESVDSDDVTIRVSHTNAGSASADNPATFNQPSNPQDVAVSGEKLRITLDDTHPGSVDDTKEGIYVGDDGNHYHRPGRRPVQSHRGR